jgi:two-component system nitrate/nitrite response regulator NarL
MPTTPLRIVIVDDNLHYRNTISSYLQKKNNFQVVAEVGDGLAAIQAVEKHRPDVVLMDVSMPVMDGIDATWVIKSKFPEIRVIVLTMHDVGSISGAAFKAGTFWCLNKECSPNEIIKAIRTAVI